MLALCSAAPAWRASHSMPRSAWRRTHPKASTEFPELQRIWKVVRVLGCRPAEEEVVLERALDERLCGQHRHLGSDAALWRRSGLRSKAPVHKGQSWVQGEGRVTCMGMSANAPNVRAAPFSSAHHDLLWEARANAGVGEMRATEQLEQA